MKYKIKEIIPTVQYGNITIEVSGEDSGGLVEAFDELRSDKCPKPEQKDSNVEQANKEIQIESNKKKPF